MSKVYIYTLCVNSIPFYVGRTNDPKRRLREHLKDLSTTKKALFIQESLRNGKTVDLVVIDDREAEQLDDLEFETIQVLSGQYELYNSRNGDSGLLNGKDARELNSVIQSVKDRAKKQKALQKLKGDFIPYHDCDSNCGAFCKRHVEESRRQIIKYELGEITLDELRASSDERKKRKTCQH